MLLLKAWKCHGKQLRLITLFGYKSLYEEAISKGAAAVAAETQEYWSCQDSEMTIKAIGGCGKDPGEPTEQAVQAMDGR